MMAFGQDGDAPATTVLVRMALEWLMILDQVVLSDGTLRRRATAKVVPSLRTRLLVELGSQSKSQPYML